MIQTKIKLNRTHNSEDDGEEEDENLQDPLEALMKPAGPAALSSQKVKIARQVEQRSISVREAISSRMTVRACMYVCVILCMCSVRKCLGYRDIVAFFAAVSALLHVCVYVYMYKSMCMF